MADLNNIDPTIAETPDGGSIFPITKTNKDEFAQIDDKDWVKQAFLISDINLDESFDRANRYFSSASMKFTSTKLGNNIGINARPGFTPYADIRQGRKNSVFRPPTVGSISNCGLGRYYSEAIDDPSQMIFIRFGVPQFNGLLNFFARAYDANMTTLAKTGRGLGFFYNLGDFAGTAVGTVYMPQLAVLSFLNGTIETLFGRPTTKFYTLKPTMHTYWSAVNTLVNSLAVNRGILPKILSDDKNQKLGGQPFRLDTEYLEEIKKLMPDLFTGNGENANYIDVFAIASKAQRTANNVFMAEYDASKNSDDYNSHIGFLKKRSDILKTDMVNPGGISTFFNWVNEKLMTHSYYKADKAVGKNSVGEETTLIKTEQTELDPRIDTSDQKGGQLKEAPAGFAEYFDAEFRQGSQFAVFRVDSTGSVSESFSNVTTESELSQKLNSTASQIRDVRFSLADGNLIDNTLTNAVGKVVGAAADFAMGAVSGVTFGISDLIMGLANAGYIDIPKHWQNSNAKLPTASYKMKLVSPYGNVMSQFQNMYIPLCMLLAGTLPLSAGRSAYGSPLICQVFDRGRCQIKLGIIESLSITRGTTNLPFNTTGNALGIDVSFTIADLSSIMHMPLTSSGIFGNKIEMTLDEDNILSDYLAVLAGQDIYSQIFALPKAKLRLAKKLLTLNRLTSPAEWASIAHETLTSGSLSWTLVGNVLENLVGSSAILSGSTNATRV
jgi:hypothetical protein